VTLRALVVPGLLPPGPVEGVRRPESLARIELEPPLTALGRGRVSQAMPSAWSRPPGNGVLLEGLHAEGVGGLELAE
jgi:hypothetical protein